MDFDVIGAGNLDDGIPAGFDGDQEYIAGGVDVWVLAEAVGQFGVLGEEIARGSAMSTSISERRLS